MSYERLIYDHNIVGSKQRQTMHSLWFLRGLPFLIRPLEIEDRAACYTFDRTNLWVHRTLLIHSLLSVNYQNIQAVVVSSSPVPSDYLLEIVFRESHKLISESLLIRRTRSSCYPVSLKEKRDKDDYRMYARGKWLSGHNSPAPIEKCWWCCF